MAIDQFNRSLPMVLHRALDAVMPRFRKIFNDFGLTEQQGRVLRVLWEHEQITLRELSDLTLIAAPSLVGIVDRLQRAGLVARRKSDRDRRKVFVQTTRTGAALEADIMPAIASAYARLKQSVDAGTWEQVLDGLEQIANPGGGRPGDSPDDSPARRDSAPVVLPDL
ncbi:MAG: MarR family transcriptional regulator [Gammaproteobacteria bacterium]|nr:MarR family transcriptional regulator [Gammaproteobacteria bacterium]MDH3428425.1 MarR family transcriptional regulator [Gammaproteobacteria bacterium]MDH3434341.1 MarR family transcriptional regulator [Gammaproteobacteria bacterium]